MDHHVPVVIDRVDDVPHTIAQCPRSRTIWEMIERVFVYVVDSGVKEEREQNGCRSNIA